MAGGRFLFLAALLLFVGGAFAESVLWDDAKNLVISKVLVEAPKEFTNCIISPDAGSGWDTCTAYATVFNNFSSVTAGQVNAVSKWKSANVQNITFGFTKEVSTSTVSEFIPFNETYNLTINHTIKTFGNFSPVLPGVAKGETLGIRLTFQKPSWTSNAFNLSFTAGPVNVELDPDISGCGDLTTPNSVYTLTADLQAAGTCLNVTANNVTIQGAGYGLNWSASQNGVGIRINSSNVTVRDLTLRQLNTSNGLLDVHAIEVTAGGAGLVLTNLTITQNNAPSVILLAGTSTGARLENSSISYNGPFVAVNGFVDSGAANLYLGFNTFSSTVATQAAISLGASDGGFIEGTNVTWSAGNGKAIYINGATNLLVSGGVYTAGAFDVFFDSVGASVLFRGVALSSDKSVSLPQGGRFNFANDTTALMLNTTAPGATGGGPSRRLLSWADTLISWNESTLASVVLTYTLSGLLPNIPYDISNATGVKAVTTDAGGNLSFSEMVSTTVRTLKINASSPPILVVQSPANITYSVANVSLNYTVGDNGVLDACWYALDGAASVSLPSCANSTLGNLTDGGHSLVVSANDTEGHLTSVSVSFSIDTIAPNVVIQLPANATYGLSLNQTLNYTAFDAGLLDTCTYELNGVNTTITAGCQNTTFIGVEGGNTIKVWANDSVGNLQDSAVVSFSVDSVNPVVVCVECPVSSASSSLTFKITATDAGGVDAARLYYRGGYYAMSPVDSVYSVTIGEANNGVYVYQFFVNDSAGNLNSSISGSITVGVSGASPPSGGGGGGGSSTPVNLSVVESITYNITNVYPRGTSPIPVGVSVNLTRYILEFSRLDEPAYLLPEDSGLWRFKQSIAKVVPERFFSWPYARDVSKGEVVAVVGGLALLVLGTLGFMGGWFYFLWFVIVYGSALYLSGQPVMTTGADGLLTLVGG